MLVYARRSSRLCWAAAYVLATTYDAPPCQAFDYHGRINTGMFVSREQFTKSAQGSDGNDAWALFASAYVNASNVGPFRHELTLDVRDKYDYFGGALDPAALRLVPANEPQLRQLSVKQPDASQRLYWALGRFPVIDAAVLGNDGAELGYRWQPRLKIGGFAGLFPEQKRGRTLQLGREDQQVGAYTSYQSTQGDGLPSTTASTAFVLRRPVSTVDRPGTYVERGAPLPDGPITAQEAAADQTSPQNNYMFWYASAVHQAAAQTRLTYLSHVDLQPAVHLRNLWASAAHQVNPKLSGNVALLRLDLTEYERQRDLRDPLPPSTYTDARAQLRYKLAQTMVLEGQGDAGQRGLDDKKRASVNARVIATSLLSGSLAAYGGGGYRRNFTSRDLIARAGATFYTAHYELDWTQQLIIESHDRGETLHPVITNLSLSALLTPQLMSSFSLELAKDERVTIISALATLGYRFGNRQLTPIRERAARMERL